MDAAVDPGVGSVIGSRPDAEPANGSPPDAGSNASPDGGSGSKDVDGGTACIKAVAANGSGHHNQGEDCAQCHTFTVAGTVFSTIDGTTPVAGATIEVIDANGTVVHLATAQNGNFYTSAPLTAPFRVRASQCPADAQMMAEVTQAGCNGCHGSGNRIHLP